LLWKQLLRKNGSINNTYYVSYDCSLIIDNQIKKLCDITTKDLYWHLVSKVCERPTSESKWIEKLSFEITPEMWKLIYTADKNLTNDTQLLNFQYKLTHRLTACKYNLYIWKIAKDNLCESCSEIDSIEHHLVNCSNTK